ncbi:MAG TPA: phospholipid carrier-dependent glycosyltransferase [Candidatus Dormibacteraeota bacterium]|nr:phospholipid carrier-dependent glycosyltransferase [Candidatus Dormibacteraeota bacterium]
MTTEPARSRAGTLLEWLRLQRIDVLALIALTAVAFCIRFFSPIQPNFLVHPGNGPAITDCVTTTPVDPQGDLGTLCGLAYPFTRGYADAGGALQPPNGQVFDEVYFPVDARDDVKGMESCRPSTVACQYNYFDPEPPLAKLVIAAGEVGYGWYLATFQGAHGDYVDLGFNTFGWRIAVCIVGTLCVPLMYLLALRLWPNRVFAFAAGVFVCFDGMFFVQSRIGMIDIIPAFLIILCYYLFLVHMQSRTAWTSLASLLVLGAAIGVGIAAKWIVLAAFASILFFLFVWIVKRISTGDLEAPGGAPWAVYLTVALVAFVALPTLIYVASWFPFFDRGQFHNLADLITYNKQAYDYHAHLTATHPYGSPWWSWPLLARPVLYYAEYQGLGTDQFTGQPLFALIYNLGNPWIWWTSLPCLVSLPYFVIRHRSFPAAVILVGFITQYLPWAPITRVLFMYEMIGGLIFMVLALAFVLGQIAEHWPGWGRKLALAHLGVAVVAFMYFYPLWAAVPLGAPAWSEGAQSPPWGAKRWFTNCNEHPELHPAIFCWY